MKTILLFIGFCFLFIGNILAQPDTTTNRYATALDASYWSTVNQGDFIFFKGNNDNNRSIYFNGSTGRIVTLPLGKKILIWRGEYRRIFINGSTCTSSATQPTIITNLGGQVKWGYSTAQNHYRSLELYNFEYIHLTGKYDPIAQTGDPNYLGHNNGNDYDSPNFHEHYGLWGNPRWSGQRYNSTFSNIVRIRGFQSCKVAYVAASEGGFAGFNIKTDNPTIPSEVEIDIQDCFVAMTESEGFYISYSTSAANQDITKLTLRNNIMAFCGTESMQTDNLVEGSLIEHNVAFAGACFHRRPFQDYYQDGLHQFSFCEGGVTVQNNAMITGSSLHQLRYKAPGVGRVNPSLTKKVLMKNNYYGFSRSNVSYTWQGDGITPYLIDSNIYGPISPTTTRDAYTSITEWPHYFRICNSNTSIAIHNTIYPQGRPLYKDYCGSNVIDTVQNITAVAPVLEFVNSGFPDTTDYRNITYWSAEYETAEKAGIFIPYEIGDYVFYDDTLGHTHFYVCIQAHAGNYNPNNAPLYWQLKTWNGHRLPPLDLRMRDGSFYDQRNIGLIYKDIALNTGSITIDQSIQNLLIYPNPTQQIIYIGSDSKIKQVTLIDLQGRAFFHKKEYNAGEPINLGLRAAGIYFAKVQFTDGNITTQKFVIKN